MRECKFHVKTDRLAHAQPAALRALAAEAATRQVRLTPEENESGAMQVVFAGPNGCRGRPRGLHAPETPVQKRRKPGLR
jgi:hypothetical protein